MYDKELEAEYVAYGLIVHFLTVLSLKLLSLKFLPNEKLFTDGSCQGLELLAAVLHVLEEVEAGAAWAQQYGVAWLGQLLAGSHAVFHAVGVANRNAQGVEVVVQLLVVGSEIYDTCTLLLYQVLDLVIIVALVLTTDDEDGRGCHALQSVPASIHIGSL